MVSSYTKMQFHLEQGSRKGRRAASMPLAPNTQVFLATLAQTGGAESKVDESIPLQRSPVIQAQ
jgi:hypothetical protein